MFGMFYDEQIMQQIIEPTGTMADLLLTLQKFVIEDNKLQSYFGSRLICQNEIYHIHYCTPMEKNILLQQLIHLFETKEDMPRQDLLYIDTQHNFKIPEYAYVAQCYCKQDLAIQLNAARYILKKNRSIRLIIIDSFWKSKEQKRRTSKTIGEKTIQFDREVESVIDELIQSLREFNAIVIVFYQIKFPQNLIKLSQNNQLVISEKIAGLLDNIYLIPPMFYEQNLYNYVYNINPNNVAATCISVLESKSKIIYSIFDDKNILQTGEAQT